MTQRYPVDRQVLVIGAGADAEWASAELDRLGYVVHRVAPEDELLGDGAGPRTLSYEGALLERLDGHAGAYRVRVRRGGQSATLMVSAVVVATGNRRWFPAERYGIAPGAGVLSVVQVRRQLDAPRETGPALPHRNRRVFIMLDLHGQTAKETATEALELAIDLRASWHCEVAVFYQDLKVDTWNLERLTREMRQAGVVFCRYADAEVETGDEGVRVRYVEGDLSGDLLVLPEAVGPREDSVALARLLGVRVGEDGYFQDLNIRHYRPGLSNRRGIYFAGRCHLEADVATLRDDALQAAASVDALLGAGYLEPEEARALVDSERCIRCLTCVRSCPHGAVELADYGAVTAAKVLDVACYGCGRCVVNCPAKAIELLAQTVPAWAAR